MSGYAKQLSSWVCGERWLYDTLRLVREFGPPLGYVGAGSIRNLVWNRCTGRDSAGAETDVDVVYFDPTESSDRSHQYQAILVERDQTLEFEVINQAFVHIWLRQVTGGARSAFNSLEEALRSWPETATAVAVRLDERDCLDVIAPFGLDDLFRLVVRPNPQCPSPEAYKARVSQKAWASRWPELHIHPSL